MPKVVLQVASSLTKKLPSLQKIRQWGEAVLAHEKQTQSEVCIRMVDAPESAELNQRFRHQEGPTNVLSFVGAGEVLGAPFFYLGDIVLCAPLVIQEALQQNKSTEAHCAHLIVHGILHLLGFDHHAPAQAHIMEAKEIVILKSFGIENPYEIST